VLKHACVPLSGCYHDFVDRSVERERWTGDGDEIVVLHGISWTEFQRRMDARARAGRHQPRMAYLDGDLELVTRGWKHERSSSQLGHLLAAFMLERGYEFTTTAEWTHLAKHKRAGLEADDSYILTGDPERRKKIDLAIEVVVTSGGLEKLEVYRRFAIREVWFVIDDAIEVHRLERGTYKRVERSGWFPDLDLELIAKFMGLTPTSAAIRAYVAALRAAKPT